MGDIHKKFNSLTNFNLENKEIFKLFFERFNENINHLFELWFIEEYKKHSEYKSIEDVVEEFYNFLVKKLTNQSVTLSIKNTSKQDNLLTNTNISITDAINKKIYKTGIYYSNTNYNISDIFNFPFMFFELRENKNLTGKQLKQLTDLEKEENILTISKKIFSMIKDKDSNINKSKYEDAITKLNDITNNLKQATSISDSGIIGGAISQLERRRRGNVDNYDDLKGNSEAMLEEKEGEGDNESLVSLGESSSVGSFTEYRGSTVSSGVSSRDSSSVGTFTTSTASTTIDDTGKDILEAINKYIRYRLLFVFARNADKELMNHLSNINVSDIVKTHEETKSKPSYQGNQWDGDTKFNDVLKYTNDNIDNVTNIYNVVESLIKDKPKNLIDYKKKKLESKKMELTKLRDAIKDDDDKEFFENQLEIVNNKLNELDISNNNLYPLDKHFRFIDSQKKNIIFLILFLFVNKSITSGDENLQEQEKQNFLFSFIKEVIDELNYAKIESKHYLPIIEQLYSESANISKYKPDEINVSYKMGNEGKDMINFIKKIIKEYPTDGEKGAKKVDPTIKKNLIEKQMSTIIGFSNLIKNNLINKYINKNKSKNINIDFSIIKLFTNRISYVIHHLFDIINNIDIDKGWVEPEKKNIQNKILNSFLISESLNARAVLNKKNVKPLPRDEKTNTLEFFDTIVENYPNLKNREFNEILTYTDDTNIVNEQKNNDDVDGITKIFDKFCGEEIPDTIKLIIPGSFLKKVKNYLNNEEKQIENKKINFHQMYNNIEKNSYKKKVRYALKNLIKIMINASKGELHSLMTDTFFNDLKYYLSTIFSWTLTTSDQSMEYNKGLDSPWELYLDDIKSNDNLKVPHWLTYWWGFGKTIGSHLTFLTELRTTQIANSKLPGADSIAIFDYIINNGSEYTIQNIYKNTNFFLNDLDFEKFIYLINVLQNNWDKTFNDFKNGLDNYNIVKLVHRYISRIISLKLNYESYHDSLNTSSMGNITDIGSTISEAFNIENFDILNDLNQTFNDIFIPFKITNNVLNDTTIKTYLKKNYN